MDVPFADQLLKWYVTRLNHGPKKVQPISTLDLKNVKRVLLVLTTGLGDAVLSTPVFTNLRQALPNADIRLLCRKNWVSLFEHDADLNKIIVYHGKYRRFFPTLTQLKDFAPDLTLVLHGNDPDIIPLVYLSGSPYIVRIPVSTTRYPFLLSNQSREQDKNTIDNLHYIDNRLRILDTIRVAATSRFPRIYLKPELINSTLDKIHQLGSINSYWVYHPFAADMYKTWPLDKAQAFLNSAIEQSNSMVLITGNHAQRAAIDILLQSLPAGKAINVAGSLNIAETAAILSKAKYVVAPDTGILHLAAALNVPTLGLYAATSAKLVGPRAQSARQVIIQKSPLHTPCFEKKCTAPPNCCMNQINIEEVCNTFNELATDVNK